MFSGGEPTFGVSGVRVRFGVGVGVAVQVKVFPTAFLVLHVSLGHFHGIKNRVFFFLLSWCLSE